MRRVFAVMVAVCVSAPVFAQSPFPVSVDQRVRVTLVTGTRVVGRVSAVAANGFQIAGDDGRTHAANSNELKQIEVSRGRTSKWKKYALRGAIISGVIGAISLGLQHDAVGEDGSSVGEAVALGVWSGGLFGGLIGGAIGAAKSADQWERVWP
jgi:hypothetical protein